MKALIKDKHSPTGKTEILIDKQDWDSISDMSCFIVTHYPETPNPRKDVHIYDNNIKKATTLTRYLLKPDKYLQVDHINRNPLDNRRENLRCVTRSQNMLNKDYKRFSPGKQPGVFLTEQGTYKIKFFKDKILYSAYGIVTQEKAIEIYNLLYKAVHKV